MLGRRRLWLLVLSCAITRINGRSRGYALSFQGTGGIAGTRRGSLDFENNAALKKLGESEQYTICGWFKYSLGRLYGPALTLGTSGSGTLDFLYTIVHHGGFQYFAGFLDPKMHQKGYWHHFALVVDGGVWKTYLNGTLKVVWPFEYWGLMETPLTLKRLSPNMTLAIGGKLLIGAHVNTNSFGAGIRREMGIATFFHGKMDDLSFYSAALDEGELLHAMKYPINMSNVPADLAIHYNFDVLGCSEQAKQSLYHDSCEITGTGQVRNIGHAGSDYDLLLGQLNDDNGFGRYWRDEFSRDFADKYDFELPTISIETAPQFDTTSGDDPQIPTVVQVLFDSTVVIRLPRGVTPDMITSLPLVGTILRGSNNETLSLNEDISTETELHYVAAPQDNFEEPLWFEVTLTGGVTHQIHVWPFRPPKLSSLDRLFYANSRVEVNVRQGELHIAELVSFYHSETGEDLDMRILAPLVKPERFNITGTIIYYHMENYQLVFEEHEYLIDDNYIPRSHGLALKITPAKGFSGIDKLFVEYVSPSSGFKTAVLEVDLKAILVDQLPLVIPPNDTIIVEEDEQQGTTFRVGAFDEESKFGGGVSVIVSSIPKKGTLYTRTGEGNWTKLNPYNIYEAGSYFEQYVHKVTNFSSFFITPPDSAESPLKSHPMLLQGPPSCLKTLCRFPSSMAPSQVGHYVDVNIHSPFSPFANASLSRVYVAARILSIENDEFFTVEVVPMFKRQQNGKVVQCITTGSAFGKAYPDNCDPSLVDGSPIILSNLPRDEIYKFPNSWSILNAVYMGDKPVETGIPEDKAIIYGIEYAFHHVGSNFYDSGVDPPYTDYLEVEYLEAVYPVMIQLGFPTSGGSLVRIRAETPTGDWTIVYEGYPQIQKAERAHERDEIFLFDERLCRTNFKTKRFRLEFDKHHKTGIGSRFELDYIRLVGSAEPPTGVLGFEQTELKYVPFPDAYGFDTFQIQASDCVGSINRFSLNKKDVRINIKPIPDPPRVYSKVKLGAVCDGLYANVTIELQVVEVDGDPVVVSVGANPTYGRLYQNLQQLKKNSKLGEESKEKYVLEYSFARCHDIMYTSRGGSVESDYVEINVTDSTSSSVSRTIEVLLFVENRRLATVSKHIAMAFFGINVTLAVICLIWVILNKNHPVVRASQVEFLCMIAFGTIISSSTIVTFTVDDGIDGENSSTADTACLIMPWLYTVGFMTTFVPLNAKLYKVYKLFDSDFAVKLRTCTPSDKKVMKKAISVQGLLIRSCMFWVVDIVIVLIWTLYKPLGFHRSYVSFFETELLNGTYASESHGGCSSGDADSIFIAMIAIYHIGVLSLVAYYCYKTMHVNDTFSEAKYLRVSIASSLQILLFSIPVLFLTSGALDPEISVFIRSGVIWFNDLTVLLFIFLPKMNMKLNGVHDSGAGFAALKESIERKEDSSKKKKGVRPQEAAVSPNP